MLDPPAAGVEHVFLGGRGAVLGVGGLVDWLASPISRSLRPCFREGRGKTHTERKRTRRTQAEGAVDVHDACSAE